MTESPDQPKRITVGTYVDFKPAPGVPREAVGRVRFIVGEMVTVTAFLADGSRPVWIALMADLTPQAEQ